MNQILLAKTVTFRLKGWSLVLSTLAVLSASCASGTTQPESIANPGGGDDVDDGTPDPSTAVVTGTVCPNPLPERLREDICFHAIFEDAKVFNGEILRTHSKYEVLGTGTAELTDRISQTAGIFSDTAGLQVRAFDNAGTLVSPVESAAFPSTVVNEENCPVTTSYFIPVDPARAPYSLEVTGNAGASFVVLEDVSFYCN